MVDSNLLLNSLYAFEPEGTIYELDKDAIECLCRNTVCKEAALYWYDADYPPYDKDEAKRLSFCNWVDLIDRKSGLSERGMRDCFLENIEAVQELDDAENRIWIMQNKQKETLVYTYSRDKNNMKYDMLFVFAGRKNA